MPLVTLGDIPIRELIDQVIRGQIRLPAFQRGFVWEPDAVAFLMDSLYKKYPIGSLLIWRASTPLKYERNLDSFVLPKPQADYPIDYVLDGQQRITSLFGVFQTTLKPTAPIEWNKIYFDFKADAGLQDSQFLSLKDTDVDLSRHFPLNCLFSADYRKATRDLSETDALKIDDLLKTFLELRIPVQLITTEDRATVAIIFERINRAGVALDTLQLLTAWTWSEEFTLHERFDDLTLELEPYGFKDVGADVNLLLRCFAAMLLGEAAPDTLVKLDGAQVRGRFDEVINGVKGALDFLKQNVKVQCLANLPFNTIIVPLTVFFASPADTQQVVSAAQRQQLLRWFWRCCFARRYSSGTLRNLKVDISEMVKLKAGQHSSLGDFPAAVDHEFFLTNIFRAGTVNTDTLILMLANQNPLSFVSGNPVTLEQVLREGNRNEFHHIYPRAYVRSSGQEGDGDFNSLANFCFLSRTDNNHLGGVAPSVYRAKMAADVEHILEKALCPTTMFNDRFGEFLQERARLLAAKANELMQ